MCIYIYLCINISIHIYIYIYTHTAGACIKSSDSANMSIIGAHTRSMVQCVAACCSALQSTATCGNVLQSVAEHLHQFSQHIHLRCARQEEFAVRCNVLQCVAACRSAL